MSNKEKVRYDHLSFRLATWDEEARIIDFVNDHFDIRLPLVNNRTFFEYYYHGAQLQFALAEQDGVLVSIAGYILANKSDNPDLWVSVWVALKGAQGAGLELMNAIPALTNARVVACNNIREKTCPFYRFLGWTAERLPHYYRLSKAASEGNYQLYRPAGDGSAPTCAVPRLAVTGDLTLHEVSTVAQLQQLGLPAPLAPATEAQTPHKDIAYLEHRYFHCPHLTYRVWAVQESDQLLAYCVTRTVNSYVEGDDAACPTDTTAQSLGCIPVLRIVDFIGSATVLPRIGLALDALMEAEYAEYTDCYCAGISADIFAAAGFCERTADGTEIVPNYLTPALIANTDYFYFTNQPEHFTMFKADGDQDRANLL